ncbi:hypothetical protein ACJX0J_026681, partial [Zea mays]
VPKCSTLFVTTSALKNHTAAVLENTACLHKDCATRVSLLKFSNPYPSIHKYKGKFVTPFTSALDAHRVAASPTRRGIWFDT